MSWATEEPTEQAPALPPRRWLRRTLWGFAAFAVLVVGFGTWRWFSTNAGIAGRLAAIRARGEPVTPDELIASIPEVPRVQDATDLWLQAIADVGPALQTPLRREMPYAGDGDAPPAAGTPWSGLTATEQFLKANAPLLELLHEATAQGGRARLQSLIIAPTPTAPMDIDSDIIAALRSCSRVLRLEAAYHAYREDAAQTAGSILAGLRASQAIANQPMIVPQLVRIAMFSMGAEALKATLPVLDYSDQELQNFAGCLGEIDFRSTIKTMLLGERVWGLEQYDALQVNMFGKGAPFGTILFSSDKNAYLSVMDDLIAATEKDWPDCDIACATALQAMVNNATWRTPLTKLLVPAFDAAIKAAERGETTRRLLIVAVALERYRRRNGHAAPDLAALVPEYLAEVPTDPTSGKAFEYKSQPDGAGYVLFSPTQQFSLPTGDKLDAETGANPLLVFRYPPLEEAGTEARDESLNAEDGAR